MCRNRSAELLYGYSASEAIGQDLLELITDSKDHAVAKIIIHRVQMGENWTGQFPVKNKQGDRFLVVATDTPLYDDDGTFVGIICVSTDASPFHESSADVKHTEADKSSGRPRSIANATLGLDPLQPLQVAIASKISNLVSVKLFDMLSFSFLFNLFLLFCMRYLCADVMKTSNRLQR